MYILIYTYIGVYLDISILLKRLATDFSLYKILFELTLFKAVSTVGVSHPLLPPPTCKA